MELFDRLDRISKTDINQILIKATNPEEVLDRIIDEIEQTWLQTRQAIDAELNELRSQLEDM